MKRYQIQLMCGIVLKQFVLLLLNYIQFVEKLKLLLNQIMLMDFVEFVATTFYTQAKLYINFLINLG